MFNLKLKVCLAGIFQGNFKKNFNKKLYNFNYLLKHFVGFVCTIQLHPVLLVKSCVDLLAEKAMGVLPIAFLYAFYKF